MPGVVEEAAGEGEGFGWEGGGGEEVVRRGRGGEGEEEESKSVRIGEPGRLLTGEPGWELWRVGCRVKRKRPLGICQKVRLETNISSQPWWFSSMPVPTAESIVLIKPMRSSLGIMFRVRRTPSRLMRMRHSPRGRASGGVPRDSLVSRYGSGSGCWKYQYRVIHIIRAIWREALAGGRKSLLEGLEMEEMKTVSFCKVGLLYLWM